MFGIIPVQVMSTYISILQFGAIYIFVYGEFLVPDVLSFYLSYFPDAKSQYTVCPILPYPNLSLHSLIAFNWDEPPPRFRAVPG